jgi:hypothetical protein
MQAALADRGYGDRLPSAVLRSKDGATASSEWGVQMMRAAFVILSAGIGIALLVTGGPAAAKAHPRTPGRDCGGLVQRVGSGNVWRTFFHGERETLFDHRWPFTAAPCFLSRSDCVNWLYWAQTDYPLEQEVRTCRRGLG